MCFSSANVCWLASVHASRRNRRMAETKVGRGTKCGPLAFVIICQFSLRQLPLSSLSDLTQGSETVTRWQRHLSACAGWNVEVLPLTSACQTANRLSPDPHQPLYLFPGNGRRLEIRIIVNQQILRLFMQRLECRERIGVGFWHRLEMWQIDCLRLMAVVTTPPDPAFVLIFFFFTRSGQDGAQCQEDNRQYWLKVIV